MGEGVTTGVVSGAGISVGIGVGIGMGVGVGRTKLGTVSGRNQSVACTPSG